MSVAVLGCADRRCGAFRCVKALFLLGWNRYSFVQVGLECVVMQTRSDRDIKWIVVLEFIPFEQIQKRRL